MDTQSENNQISPLIRGTISIGEAVQEGAKRLKEAGMASPRLDTELLLAFTKGVRREDVLRDWDMPLSSVESARFEELLLKRENHMPIAKITGMKPFWKEEFRVSEAVLDPRPDSETLIEASLDFFAGSERPTPLRILDLGTGSGCLLLSLLAEWPKAYGVGFDVSEAALEIAKENATRLGLMDRAVFRQGDWNLEWNFPEMRNGFDLILSNPPYIRASDMAGLDKDVRAYDPSLALEGGEDGLAAYRVILRGIGTLLRPGGGVIFEIGEGGEAGVRELIERAGGEVVRAVADLSHISRCLIACWPIKNGS